MKNIITIDGQKYAIKDSRNGVNKVLVPIVPRTFADIQADAIDFLSENEYELMDALFTIEGRTTTCVISVPGEEDNETIIFTGKAVCSPTDTFNPYTGMAVAACRALYNCDPDFEV